MSDSAKITQTFNGTAEWNVQGSYFKLMSTVSAVTVRLYYKGNRVHEAENVEAGHYQRVKFDLVRITTSASEAVSWLYAPDDGGSDRFTGLFTAQGTLGTLAQVLVNAFNWLRVSVQGHGDAESASAFSSYGVVGASVGNYNHAQVKNPAGSGKLVFVDGFWISTANATAERFVWGSYNTDLTTIADNLQPKDVGAAAASAVLRVQSNGAGLITSTLGSVVVQSLESKYVRLDPPVKLGQGEGLVVIGLTTNTGLMASFDAREYAA